MPFFTVSPYSFQPYMTRITDPRTDEFLPGFES